MPMGIIFPISAPTFLHKHLVCDLGFIFILLVIYSIVYLNCSSLRFTVCGVGGTLLLSGLVVLTCIDQDEARHSFGHAGGMLTITTCAVDNLTKLIWKHVLTFQNVLTIDVAHKMVMGIGYWWVELGPDQDFFFVFLEVYMYWSIQVQVENSINLYVGYSLDPSIDNMCLKYVTSLSLLDIYP